MSDVTAGALHLWDELVNRLEEVKSYELDPGVLPVVLERASRGNDDLGPWRMISITSDASMLVTFTILSSEGE